MIMTRKKRSYKPPTEEEFKAAVDSTDSVRAPEPQEDKTQIQKNCPMQGDGKPNG